MQKYLKQSLLLGLIFISFLSINMISNNNVPINSNPSEIHTSDWDFVDYGESVSIDLKTKPYEEIWWDFYSNWGPAITVYASNGTYSETLSGGTYMSDSGNWMPPSPGDWTLWFENDDSKYQSSTDLNYGAGINDMLVTNLSYTENATVTVNASPGSFLSWRLEVWTGPEDITIIVSNGTYNQTLPGTPTTWNSGMWNFTSPGAWEIIFLHDDSIDQTDADLHFFAYVDDAFDFASPNDDQNWATFLSTGVNYTGLYLHRNSLDWYNFTVMENYILQIYIYYNRSEYHIDLDDWEGISLYNGSYWNSDSHVKAEQFEYKNYVVILDPRVRSANLTNYSLQLESWQNVPYSIYINLTEYNYTLKWDWDVLPGQNVYWTLGYNVRMDFPGVVWESLSDQIASGMDDGMGMPIEHDFDIDLEYMYLEYMSNLPNSWHLKANIQQIGAGPLYYFCPVGDVIYADVTMKENTDTSYHFLDDAFMEIIDDMMNMLPFGGMMEYPNFEENMGLDLPLVQWPHEYTTPIGELFFPLGGGGPLLPPAAIKPSNYSFADFYDDLKYVFENNVDMGSNFIDFEDFIDQVGIVNYNFTANGFSLEHDLLSATLDLNDIDDEEFPVPTPVIYELENSLLPEIETALGGAIILDDTTLKMNVSYDEKGVLEKFHVLGELSATYYKDNSAEEYTLFMYFEIIVMKGVQPELIYMYDRPSQVEDIPGFPIVTFLLFASLGIILVLRKVVRVKDKHVS